MNQKEALLSMKLGNRITRSKWELNAHVSLYGNTITMHFHEGGVLHDSIPNFLTQEHNDWVVYCPQGNEQNPEGDDNVNNTTCTKAT